MRDYKSMYFTLFNSLSDAINILQKAQQDTEEAYLSEDTPISEIIDITCHLKGE